MIKPKVFKMAGVWLWTCGPNTDHHGPVGDEFRAGQWRDPWTAVLAAATKHAVSYHNQEEGEQIL